MVDEAITTEEEKRQAKAEADAAAERLSQRLNRPGAQLRYEATDAGTYEQMSERITLGPGWGTGWNEQTGRFE